MVATTSQSSQRPARSRKLRAVLAGGLVLGIGGAVTLAAWNDSEFASGLFSSGEFNLQGSIDNAAYTDHESSDGAAALEFSVPVDNMSPGDVVAAPFWVRLDATTTTPATLDLVSVTGTDTTGANTAELGYDVYALADGATCDETATGTVVGRGDTLVTNEDVAGETVPLSVGAAEGDPGVAAQLCFVVTASETLAQGGETTAVWQFTATSDSE
ncbi:SipW-dependent-type signal peptide-containing protein [Ruania zhangjianzhongii]|uniref:SipW-dependent-type signal peptide-containing protein n=1 Tax=Ruania zhangjianzhongii TaxID=2603206 RepID=UPI0011D2C194|nr:SipW-dependent-type signal peptide-containing protein [Ruania zhangjianzhongii]